MSLKDNLKVMIVDDMSVSRALLHQSLEEIGIWQVVAENSGLDALPKLAVSPVHLVISDHNMPGMNGLQLLEKLRMNKMTSRIGFILITGSSSQQLVTDGRRLGLNNLIRKPFTTITLKSSIEAVVGRL